MTKDELIAKLESLDHIPGYTEVFFYDDIGYRRVSNVEVDNLWNFNFGRYSDEIVLS